MKDERLYGCTDHGCVFGHPGGMGTNGGCQCLRRDFTRDHEARRAATKAVRSLRAKLEAAEARAVDIGSVYMGAQIEAERQRDDIRESYERECADHANTRARFTAYRNAVNNDYWSWAGDGTDNPESMCDEMAVVIRGCDLRPMALAARQRDEAFLALREGSCVVKRLIRVFPLLAGDERAVPALVWCDNVRAFLAAEPAEAVGCADCGRPYGECGFHDLVVPNAVWRRISPTGDEGGLLCPSCLVGRCAAAGIETTGALMSGPVATCSREEMQAQREAENAVEPAESQPQVWFSHDEQGDFQYHATAEEARAEAEKALGYCEDCAGDPDQGWPENTGQVCWGRVMQRAECISREPAPEGSRFNETAEYALEPAEAEEPNLRFCGCGHTEDSHLAGRECMGTVGGEECGCPGFIHPEEPQP